MDAARAGTLAPVRLIIGTNDHEMELFRPDVPALPTDSAVAFLTRKLTPVLGRRPTEGAVRPPRPDSVSGTSPGP